MRWCLVFSLLIALHAPVATQTTWYVSSTCDDTGRGTEADPFCVLQEAIDVASSGDTVIIGPGTYAGDVVVPGIQLTIRASHGSERTALRGSERAALELLPGAKLVLSDLTISRPAQALPGLLSRQASLVVEGCRFAGTESTFDGGAIQAEDGELVVRACSFLETFAYRGGAIAALRSSVRVEGCSFSSVRGFMGGAILVEDGTLLLSESMFLEAAASFGGAVYAENGSVRIDDCLFLRSGGFGFDFQQGGALWLQSTAAVVTNSSFEEGVVFSRASALRVMGGSILVEDCAFTDNYVADLAGTVEILDADARLVRCDFLDNEASLGWGGALYVEVEDDHEILVQDCRFARNKAGEGGAVCIRQGFAELERCRFTGNVARGGPFYERGHGGALFVGGFPMGPPALVFARLRRCVFDKNLALGNYALLTGGRGGGAFGPVEAWNCTFYGNLVGGSGKAAGGAAGGGAQLRNCITWMDSPDALEGTTTAAWSEIQGTWPGDGNFSADPRFRDADAGDFRLLPSSPCIDRGDPTEVDADGTRIDVGAFSYEPIPSSLVRRK